MSAILFGGQMPGGKFPDTIVTKSISRQFGLPEENRIA